ncbi:TetR/AcrR family transcriptional regulator [Gloeocapsopsis dulcis]|uniref:TetR family transcriptional regulator n=1 Tax=Gloeocapsopsis dulcis AAB1 = 1H9 TaxID=1433147 RepID=A0A6N8FVM6_9CHRO|nr:TetR/AcrR family transcriptional regulator [Gloeocapsopsis dulcis]MUL36919.1 TetR family transcriptional regulator [Gloeocapsopsis dulcis AAB1 = 1H9]WNN88733.1 TetR/AcrR family transcriptional regulator [Gloeocapsopsis dulcis]
MSKEETIIQLLQVFRQYGYEGATLTRLSQATGLGKASLYHHFPKGKEEMAQAVLNYINDWMETNIFVALRSHSQPIERIRAMTQKVNELYSCGEHPCLLAVLSLESKLFSKEIENALTHWINSLAQVLIDAGFEEKLAHQKAEDAVLQIQGSLILSRCLNDTAPFQRVLQRLPEELLKI